MPQNGQYGKLGCPGNRVVFGTAGPTRHCQWAVIAMRISRILSQPGQARSRRAARLRTAAATGPSLGGRDRRTR